MSAEGGLTRLDVQKEFGRNPEAQVLCPGSRYERSLSAY